MSCGVVWCQSAASFLAVQTWIAVKALHRSKAQSFDIWTCPGTALPHQRLTLLSDCLLPQIQRIRPMLQAELAAARQKEANLQAQVAEGVLEAVELRRQLHAARAAADPNIIQVSFRGPLLPAMARTHARVAATCVGPDCHVLHCRTQHVTPASAC